MNRIRSRGGRVDLLVAAALVALLTPGDGVQGRVARAADTEAPPDVVWLTYREAKAAARHRDRPLLIFFSGARNGASSRFDREIWSDPDLRAYLDDHLVTARVDVQALPAIAEHFGIEGSPAVLVAAPDGKPLAVLHGWHGPDSVLRLATFAGSRAWEYADYATWLSRQKTR